MGSLLPALFFPSSHEGEGIDGILIFLKVPNFLGGSRKDYSVTASDFLISLHLYFCFLHIIMEKLSMGCFSSLWKDFWFAVFSHVI